MADEAVAKRGWRLNREIPVAVVLMLGGQAVALITIAAVGLFRLDLAEANLNKQELRIEKLEDATNAIGLVQYRVDEMSKDFSRVEGKLDAIADDVAR